MSDISNSHLFLILTFNLPDTGRYYYGSLDFRYDTSTSTAGGHSCS